MPRRSKLMLLLAAASLLAAPVGAQGRWNDARTRALVDRAIERRQLELADTALVDYRAEARGYLTFLAQMGEGLTEPPRILKADELALEVFWKAPDQSKQRILGRRDTLLGPTDIEYHRDHLGIIQNNFPDIIRLGDGDEVSDVPHPLSPTGRTVYDFAIADSLRIGIPGRTISVYQVRVRPRDDRQPRVIGAVFLDTETSQVVRMAFGFTRAAFLDKYLEDLSIVLENGLVGGRFWLPRRQEIEIRRGGTWLDYPVRGIIRGRWEIGSYELNTGLRSEMFAGAEIVQAPREQQQQFPWTGRIMDSLPPDVRAVTADEVRRIQEEARLLVREQALRRATGARLHARNVSDFARFNRVEGLALGGGVSRQLGAGWAGEIRGRYGFADERLRGEVALAWRRGAGEGVRLFARSDLTFAGDEQERSTTVNTFAAQEFGSDHTDPFGHDRAGIRLELGRNSGIDWSLEGSFDRYSPVDVKARSARGEFAGTLDVAPSEATRLALRLDHPTRLSVLGIELQGRGELRLLNVLSPAPSLPPSEPPMPGGSGDDRFNVVSRAAATLRLERPFGSSRIISQTTAAAVSASGLVPLHQLVMFGGAMTAPGYDFHSIVGTRGVSQRLELQTPVPFPAIPLGRFGRVPAQATLAPYFGVAHVSGGAGLPPIRRTSSGAAAGETLAGTRPFAGVGILTLFDLLRLDVARGIDGGRWIFSVDVARDLWRIL
jgi:hypothetical protein